jgi:hypothetical protein
MGDSLRIPTLAAGAAGPYIPGTQSRPPCTPAWSSRIGATQGKQHAHALLDRIPNDSMIAA